MPHPDTKPDAPGSPATEPQAATPERTPQESNYGYETSHPSYKLRQAGDWSPRFGPTPDYRPSTAPSAPTSAPTPAPPGGTDTARKKPGGPLPG